MKIKEILLPLIAILFLVSCAKKFDDKIVKAPTEVHSAKASNAQALSSVDPIVQSIIYGMIEEKGVDIEDISMEAHFTFDLGFDYLDNVEMIMAVEDEFDIEIPDEDAQQINTVRDLVEYVSALTSGSNQSQIEHYSSEAETNYSYEDMDYSNGAQVGYVPILYSHQANIKYISNGPSTVRGDIASVYVFPLTCSNPVSWYKDIYGRNVTRSITIFGTNPPTSFSLLTTKSVMLQWWGSINAQYTYHNFDGTTQRTSKNWSRNHSKVATYPSFQ